MTQGADLKFLVQPHSKWQRMLQLQLRPEEIEEFVLILSGVLADKRERNFSLTSSEFGDWDLIWKSRSSGNRILLAHPDSKKWVVTVALEERNILKLKERLQSKETSKVSLEDLGTMDRVTNLMLEFHLD